MRRLALAAACAALAMSSPARAQDEHGGAGQGGPSSSPPSARNKATARQYFASGRDAYNAGRFAAAAQAFEEAYRLAPRADRPVVAYAMAQAYRRQFVLDRQPANLKRALELYRQYVADVPQGGFRAEAVKLIELLEPQWQQIQRDRIEAPTATPPPVQPTQLMITSATPGATAAVGGDALTAVPVIREVAAGTHAVRIEAPGFVPQTVKATAVEQRLISVRVQLSPKPAILRLETRAGVQVSVNGNAVSRAAASRLELPAGTHLIAVHERGHRPFVRQLSLGRGQAVDLDVALARTTQRRVSYYTAIGAGSLATFGLVASLVALRAQGKAEDIEARIGLDQLTASDRARHQGYVDDRDRWRSAAYVAFGGAAVAGIGAALLYYLDDSAPSDQSPQGLRLAPTAGPAGSGAAVFGSF